SNGSSTMPTSLPNRAVPPASPPCCATGQRAKTLSLSYPAETFRPRTTRNTLPGRRFRNDPASLFDPRLDARHLAVKLLLVYELENFADPRPWREPEREQMPAKQQRCRRMMLHPERARTFEEPVHRRAVEFSRAP